MTPPPRRILMTTDAVGGVWTYATDLARALCGLGWEVALVVIGPAPRQEQLRPLRDVRRLRVEVTDLALEWMDPAGADVPRASDALLRIADRVQPDLIHLNGYREASFDWPAPVLVVAHSCVLSWWRGCRGGVPSEARWRTFAAAAASGLAAADAWVAPTAAFRDVIDAMYSPPTDGHVIWNGVALSASSSPKQPTILAAGRLWDEAKNLASLAAVASELDWPIRVAGAAREPDAKTDGPVIDGIHCLGVLDKAALLAEMRRAGIFASPAFYEPFGLTVLEAAVCGCALVLSDIPGFRELWSGAALFVDPRDDDAVLAALQTLCRNEALRDEMQRAACVRSCRYSLAAMVSAYRDLYGTMLGSPLVKSGPRPGARLELQA